MGIFSVFGDPRSGYGSVEAFVFDRLLVKVAAPLHDVVLDRLAPMIRPQMRILDVGCGGAQFALRVAERFPDVEIEGIDRSPGQIARAVRRARRRARLSFREGNALDLPFGEAEFDLVYSIGSIKHWPDPELGLRECARVAKPNAPLLVIEGDRGCRHEDVLSLGAMVGLPQHMRAPFAAFYRVAVVGESLDLTDASELLSRVREIEGNVERICGLPVWVLQGVRSTGGTLRETTSPR